MCSCRMLEAQEVDSVHVEGDIWLFVLPPIEAQVSDTKKGYKLWQLKEDMDSLINFLNRNLRIPSDTPDGIVRFDFTINKRGKVKRVEIVESLTRRADKEAKRLIRLIHFIPATIGNGRHERPVPTRLSWQISFDK